MCVLNLTQEEIERFAVYQYCTVCLKVLPHNALMLHEDVTYCDVCGKKVHKDCTVLINDEVVCLSCLSEREE